MDALTKKLVYVVNFQHNDDAQAVKQLLENGADPNAVTTSGSSLLRTAVVFNQPATVKLLLKHKADTSHQNDDGRTALITAALQGCFEIVQALVEGGADIEQKDNRGATALINASNNGHVEIVRYLISKGADQTVQPKSYLNFYGNIFGKMASSVLGAVDNVAGGIAEGASTISQANTTLSGKSDNLTEQSGSLEALLGELNGLVGLGSVKADVAKHISLIRVQQMRREKGLSVPEQSLHMVFSGNPGTGKTSIARLIAKIYKQMDILSRGQFVETDRAGLVAEYLGQTAPKVQAVVKKAIGGVLFIDEAYTLSGNERGSDQYGQEAIDTLLKLMEDYRKDLIVIVAGYTEPMQRFIESNPGLQSRFNKYLHFEDYSPDDLTSIFTRLAKQHDYKLTATAQAKVTSVFRHAYQNRNRTFGNARLSRNLFEKAVSDHAMRIGSLPNVSESDLVTIAAEDIQP